MNVSALYCYPVKACRGVALDTAEIERRGFAGDRRWMVVDDNGRFISQREQPRLTLVETRFDGEALVLAAPGHAAIAIPRTGHTGPALEVVVQKAQVSAQVHADASAWFSRVLGLPCRAVYMPDATERAVNPERARPGDIVSFADAYPILLASEASLAELNARMPTPIATMARFRPNIVATGCAPFAEDTWRELRIGDLHLRNVKPCDRCKVTTVDPTTAETGKEPLATLATFRRRDGQVWFGVNLIPDTFGPIHLGAPIEVVAEQPPFIT